VLSPLSLYHKTTELKVNFLWANRLGLIKVLKFLCSQQHIWYSRFLAVDKSAVQLTKADPHFFDLHRAVHSFGTSSAHGDFLNQCSNMNHSIKLIFISATASLIPAYAVRQETWHAHGCVCPFTLRASVLLTIPTHRWLVGADPTDWLHC